MTYFDTRLMAGEEIAIVMWGMLLVWILVGVALYAYIALALMAIAKKTKTPNGWLAFIPLVNIYLMIQMADLQWWWIFMLLLPLIPFFGQVALAGITVYVYWKIAERINKPGWWAFLMLLPIVNLVVLGMMAWGK